MLELWEGGKLGRYHLEQDVRSDGINTFKV